MKRGPKPGKARAATPLVLRDDLGEPPGSLGSLGSEFWIDAVAHMKATGRSSRVYRHPLLLVCQLLDGLRVEDAGVNKLDTCRRWLNELGLTPASSKGTTTEGTPTHGEAKTGKARLLQLIAGRAAGR